MRNAPEGTRLDKINLVIPSLGTVTGAGTVSPSKALDFKMVANLAGVGAGLTKVAGLGAGGIPVSRWGHHFEPNLCAGHEGDGERQTERVDARRQEQSLGRPFREEEIPTRRFSDMRGGGRVSAG